MFKNLNMSTAKQSLVKHGFLTGISFIALPALGLAQTNVPPPPPVPSAAQAAPFPAPPPVKTNGLLDVVITARHRAERAQSVPISLTTVDAKQIQVLGTPNLGTIKQVVPSLTINAYNPRNLGFNIRNLGSTGFITYDGLENGVAVYIDGVLLGRSGAAQFDIPELQDIQVLRGPQGTLFGKNSVAGVVNIITKVPSFTPQATISGSYGNYNYWQLQGYATGAIANSDKVAMSLSFNATQNKGFMKSTNPPGTPNSGNTYNNTDNKGARAQLLLEPNDRLTVRIIANFERVDANCCIQIPLGTVNNYANGAAYNSVPGRISYTTRFADAGYTLPTINPYGRTTDINSLTHYASETGGLSVLADYDLNGYTISSITGASYWNSYPVGIDADGTGADILTAANVTTYQRQFSQEFRLTSPLGLDAPFGTHFDYTLGAFGFYQQLNSQTRFGYGNQAAAFLFATNSGPKYTIGQAALNGFGYVATDIPSTYSNAVYGQGTLHITPKLALTGGARFTYEEKFGNYYTAQQGNNLAANPSLAGIPGGAAAAQAIRNAFGVVTSYELRHMNMLPGGLVTLSYKPQDDILTYATYSHGEKSAGLNFVNSPFINKVVAPEKIDNYEVGAKTTLLNGNLLLNGDAFWENDTNFQSTIDAVVNNELTAYLANVPKVVSRGFETDIRAQVTPNLSLTSSAIYNEAYNASNPDGVCPIEVTNVHIGANANCDLSGRPIAGASKWNASFGGEYDYPLPQYGNTNTVAYFGGNVELRSYFYSTSDDGEYAKVPGYGLGNIQFGIRQANGRWDLSGWIRNVTNEHYYLFREVTGSLPTYNLVIGEVGDPITFGFTLRAKFE
jgi:iron complex outermembrane receptor protein